MHTRQNLPLLCCTFFSQRKFFYQQILTNILTLTKPFFNCTSFVLFLFIFALDFYIFFDFIHKVLTIFNFGEKMCTSFHVRSLWRLQKNSINGGCSLSTLLVSFLLVCAATSFVQLASFCSFVLFFSFFVKNKRTYTLPISN